jgi:hypothetical protein
MQAVEQKEVWAMSDRLQLCFEEEIAFERHFTPRELAKLWLLHESTIRRLFLDEPGVLKYCGSPRLNGRREYVTLRIPASVARRVYERRSR